MTDFNLYQILPETTANKMSEALSLAIEMAVQHYPHLVSQLEFTQNLYWKTAQRFTGSQNIPSVAKKAFYKESKDTKKKGDQK